MPAVRLDIHSSESLFSAAVLSTSDAGLQLCLCSPVTQIEFSEGQFRIDFALKGKEP